MKIYKEIIKEISLVGLLGNLTGHYALELQDYLNKCLDQTICFQLINFKQTFQIDSLGIRALCAYIERGGKVRIFNVEPQIRWRLEMEAAPNEIKIYNETDINMALSLFSKEISNNKDKIKKELKYRHHSRVSTCFQSICHFKTSKELVFASSKLIDLSEGGFLIDDITLLYHKDVKLITSAGFCKENLCKISFKLSKIRGYIISECSCARVIKGLDRVCIGGKFEQLSRDNSNKIRAFIHSI